MRALDSLEHIQKVANDFSFLQHLLAAANVALNASDDAGAVHNQVCALVSKSIEANQLQILNLALLLGLESLVVAA